MAPPTASLFISQPVTAARTSASPHSSSSLLSGLRSCWSCTPIGVLLRARRSIGKAVAFDRKMSRFAGIMGSSSCPPPFPVPRLPPPASCQCCRLLLLRSPHLSFRPPSFASDSPSCAGKGRQGKFFSFLGATRTSPPAHRIPQILPRAMLSSLSPGRLRVCARPSSTPPASRCHRQQPWMLNVQNAQSPPTVAAIFKCMPQVTYRH